jgi:DNA-3-methyladenine glycosylase
MARMKQLRGLPASAPLRLLTSGPGRLCQALALTRAEHNGADLLDPEGPMQLAEDGFEPGAILVTPRIGIRKAAERPLRFLLADNPCVSGRRVL